jgi:outer membrane protein assembly factor BamB
MAILVLAAIAIGFVQSWTEWPFQRKELIAVPISTGVRFISLTIGTIAGVLLLLWWLFFSRAALRLRLYPLVALVGLGVFAGLTLRIGGFTGDLIPTLEWKWRSTRKVLGSESSSGTASLRGDYPQFLGPARNGILSGSRPRIGSGSNAPVELWRVPVGAGWSGFAVAGRMAITLEQHGTTEQVVARDVITGRDVWSATNEARYFTPLGGEGPRSTPTIVDGRVLTQGATGWLQALELETGRLLWGTNILAFAEAGLPEWGISGSPLVVSNRVYALAGGREGKSLLVFDAATGRLLASGGDGSANYASPAWMTLAGTPQVVVLNGRAVTAHDPISAKVLWSRPWGTGFPLVANPVEVPGSRLLVSGGYAVGSELLEVVRDSGGTLQVSNVWSSKRLKAKFSNPIRIGTLVVGLDDGILAAIDLADGSQKWKEGRYGHGQGVWIGGLLIQMSEEGELVMLEPDATGPNERERIRVFDRKTWNPIALAGDLLLARNDREAVCYRLGLETRVAAVR